MNAKLALAAALVVALPATAYAEPLNANTVVEGHSVFVSLSPDGSSLAAVAGSVYCQVLWFNDQVLFREPAGSSGLCGDAGFVYAYPTEAPDPRGNPTLKPTGRAWDFADPNAAGWHVVEYTYQQLQVEVVQNLGLPTILGEELGLSHLAFTTWVVEAASTPIHDPTLNAEYNFVILVDTSKVLLTQPGGTTHDGTPGNVQGGNSHDATDLTRPQYQPYPHQHNKSFVSLSLGDAPPQWA